MNYKADSFLLGRPFGTAPSLLLAGWWRAATRFYSETPRGWTGASFSQDITKDFAALATRLSSGKDTHLTSGLYYSLRSRAVAEPISVSERHEHILSRPYLLLLNHFNHPQVIGRFGLKRSEALTPASRQYIFSPFLFLRQMLTAPEYRASDAYAHAVIRAEIFALALQFDDIRSKSAAKRKAPPIERIRTLIDYSAVSATLQKASDARARGDTFHPITATDFLVAHVLASRGYCALALAAGGQPMLTGRQHERPLMGIANFLSKHALVHRSEAYEFRFLDEVRQIPSVSELMNELDGLQLAIPGADAIFANGLRMTSQKGLIARISGPSGAGKTSLALAIATALAPLGTTTLYLSCEEEKVDLEKRLNAVAPAFVLKSRGLPKSISDWFDARHISSSAPDENRATLNDYIGQMLELYQSIDVHPSTDLPPGCTGLLVVLDGVHELIDRSTNQDDVLAIRELVDKVRSLGAFVILLTAEVPSAALSELDYLVDIVIRLGGGSSDNGDSNDASRRLALQKTRLQYSRMGSHLLHISKRQGVKLYPHLAAQNSLYGYWKWPNPNIEKWYDILQTGFSKKGTPEPLIKIYERSHLLVQGQGSSGKAQFALRILGKTLLGGARESEQLFDVVSLGRRQRERRSVLIISFLYQADYYRKLLEKNWETYSLDSLEGSSKPNVEIDTLDLYPGTLMPEILLRKIIDRIEMRKLQGDPWHGILIDGLHNVFLQFPKLQESALFWPTLFETLRTLGPTIVTTHTNFDVKGMARPGQLRADVDLAVQRVAPLLQVLANASDYYLDISAVERGGRSGRFPIEILSAIDQPTGGLGYYWNRTLSAVEWSEDSAPQEASQT